jgi:hypothetical protein
MILIYEVKSKSCGYEGVDDQEFKVFIKEYIRGENKGKRVTDLYWKFYLYDIAFQRYVVRNLIPENKKKNTVTNNSFFILKSFLKILDHINNTI